MGGAPPGGTIPRRATGSSFFSAVQEASGSKRTQNGKSWPVVLLGAPWGREINAQEIECLTSIGEDVLAELTRARCEKFCAEGNRIPVICEQLTTSNAHITLVTTRLQEAEKKRKSFVNRSNESSSGG